MHVGTLAVNLKLRYTYTHTCIPLPLLLRRVFSAEPNYYCEEGACAALMTELAFVKVSPEGLVCVPHGHAPPGESILAQLPSGCLNPPNRGLITN